MDKTAKPGPRRARHFHKLDNPMPLNSLVLWSKMDMIKYALAAPVLVCRVLPHFSPTAHGRRKSAAAQAHIWP